MLKMSRIVEEFKEMTAQKCPTNTIPKNIPIQQVSLGATPKATPLIQPSGSTPNYSHDRPTMSQILQRKQEKPTKLKTNEIPRKTNNDTEKLIKPQKIKNRFVSK